MTSEEIKLLDAGYIAPTYGRFDLCLVRGKGCTTWDAEGNAYLDFGSGIGTNSLGWCDAQWLAAVSAQAATLQHTSNLYYTQPAAILAQQLCQRSGLQKAFFANSGAEANEGAIKAARKYSHDKYGKGRNTIVTLENSFHGRTLATLSATGQDAFHQHFYPFVEGFVHVPAGNIAALKACIAEGGVCAVMLEAVQGEGGVLPLEKAYVQAISDLCAQQDILLIFDEVQTGIGRTGTLFAYQQLGVLPDIVTCAKGIGGGLPLAAVLFGEKTQHTLGKGQHATTFGGNPVCCAGALAVLDRLTPAFLAEVSAKGILLRTELENLPLVQSVQGQGLMLGVTLAAPATAANVVAAAMAKGLLCLTAKDNVRLLPPLTITNQEITKGIAILRQVLEEIK